jgi:hypothetical protein
MFIFKWGKKKFNFHMADQPGFHENRCFVSGITIWHMTKSKFFMKTINTFLKYYISISLFYVKKKTPSESDQNNSKTESSFA